MEKLLARFKEFSFKDEVEFTLEVTKWAHDNKLTESFTDLIQMWIEFEGKDYVLISEYQENLKNQYA